MNGTRKLIVFAALSSMSLTTASAWADATAPDREGASVGILVGYGFDGAYHLGLGARGGYTLSQKIYIGGSFTYHFGQSQDYPQGSVSEHLFYLGPEGGYDLVLGAVPQLLIRPYLGLGYENVSVSASLVGVPSSGVSANGFSFWPSVTGLYSFTPAISAGLDAKVVVATFGGGDTAFVLSLAGQWKF
jgi:outer membrane protein with beta-barrel domain